MGERGEKDGWRKKCGRREGGREGGGRNEEKEQCHTMSTRYITYLGTLGSTLLWEGGEGMDISLGRSISHDSPACKRDSIPP